MAGAVGRLTPVLALVGLVGVGWVLGLFAAHWLASPADAPLLHFVVANRSGWLTSVMAALTTLGSGTLLLFVVGGLGLAWWAWKATVVPLVLLVIAWLGAEILFGLVKVLVDRPRPPAAMAVHHFEGLAFPSGHATEATAVWGMAAAIVFVTVATRGPKVAACAGAVAIAIVVGITRVYLGAHWATDVLGGWLLGGLWLYAVLWLVGSKVGLRRAGQPAETAV